MQIVREAEEHRGEKNSQVQEKTHQEDVENNSKEVENFICFPAPFLQRKHKLCAEVSGSKGRVNLEIHEERLTFILTQFQEKKSLTNRAMRES